MLVKTLIEKLKNENPDAVVVVRSYEDGSIAEEVSNKHAKKMYWKGASPIKDKTIPSVTIGVMGDYGVEMDRTGYEKLLTQIKI